jgi:hypothetical protein
VSGGRVCYGSMAYDPEGHGGKGTEEDLQKGDMGYLQIGGVLSSVLGMPLGL